MGDGRWYDEPGVYEVRVGGILEDRWCEWFGGFEIVLREQGETLLRGSVADQAALHGLLGVIRDLGLPLVSIIRVQAEE